ncbi:MAG TPA: pitrilysin family protein [Patescibacteria group bacterium]|nr:pitrilysin family protein [Patescibacteria group bacterium]
MEIVQFRHAPFPTQKAVLNNGLTIITAETNSPIACVGIGILAGGFHGDVAGTAHFLEHIICDGPSRSGMHPRLRPFYRTGINTNAETSGRGTYYWAAGYAHQAGALIKALAEICFQPEFHHQIEEERKIILEEIAQRENPDESWKMQTLYPDAPWVHRTPLGTETSVRGIQPSDLEDFFRTHYVAARTAVIATGGIHSDEIVQIVEQCLGSLKSGTPTERFASIAPTIARAAHISAHNPPGILLYTPRQYPIPLLEDIQLDLALRTIGDSQFGELHQRLRYRTPLVYSAKIIAHEGWAPRFEIGTFCDPSKFDQVEHEIVDMFNNPATAISEEIVACQRAHLEKYFLVRGQDPSPSRWEKILRDRWMDNDWEDEDVLAIVRTIRLEDLAEVSMRHFANRPFGRLDLTRPVE